MFICEVNPSESVKAMVSHGLAHAQMDNSLDISHKCGEKVLSLNIHWNILHVQSKSVRVKCEKWIFMQLHFFAFVG